MEHGFASVIVLIAALGLASQWVAWRFKIPAIILLMLTGLIAGPATGWVQPSQEFGHGLEPVVGLFVAIILFEGGLNLRLHEFRQTASAVKRLVTVGVLLSWLLGALAAHYLGGLTWPISVLFGAIVVVTGPTVIMPLLRQAKLNQRPASLLKWEGIINDPTGALLAVLVFEYLVYAGEGVGFAQVVGGLASALAAAVVLGLGVGYLLSRAFRRGLIPEYLKPPLVFTVVLLVYQGANMAQEEAGLLAVTLLGIVMSNLQLRSIDELRRFKEYLSIILVSALFIILTADLDPQILKQLDWQHLGVLLAMVFLVRPLSVWVTTIGTGMSLKERILVGWVAPRGIVAAAMAGVFAGRMETHGYAQADLLVPLVLSLIVITVVLHGATIGWLARILGLGSEAKAGLLLVGASDWGIELARQLNQAGVPVLVADSSWYRLRAARLAGVPCYYGEILSEEREQTLDLNEVGYLLAATSNDAYNALVCTHFATELGRNNCYQLPMHGVDDKDEKAIQTTRRGITAFSEQATFENVLHHYHNGWRFHRSHITEQFGLEDHRKGCPQGSLDLMVIRNGGIARFNTEQFDLEVKPGDIVLTYAAPECASS